MTASKPVERLIRKAARIIILDPSDRVLMFQYHAPDFAPVWILPGGGCDPGEDFAAAAARELREETGIIDVPDFLGMIRQSDYEYGGKPVRSIEHFFHLRVSHTRIDISGHTELEKQVIRDHRWLAIADLPALPEPFYPQDLEQIVGTLAAETTK